MPKTFPAVSDHSWARPDPQYIVESGYLGVGRYLGYDTVTTPRDVTRAELDSYFAVGLKVFFIVQGGKDTVRGGWAQGVQYADMANALLHDMAIPEDVTIVGTVVDYEASAADLRGGIADYARGFASRSVRPHIPYGPDYALDILCGELRLFTYGWQTRAWSGGRQSKYACMTQEVGEVLGETSDHNNIVNLDDVELLLWNPDEDAQPIKIKRDDVPITIIMTTSRANREWFTAKNPDGVSIGMRSGITNVDGEPIDGTGAPLPDGWDNPYAGLAAWEVQDTHFALRKLTEEHHQFLLACKYAMALAGQEPTILDSGFVSDAELERRTYVPSDMLI